MAALAHNPIRKSWKREWPVFVVENPVSDTEKMRYAQIASDFAQRAGVNHWEETRLKSSGRVAEAFVTENDEKIIKSPATTTPYTLYIFLHEAGHHFYDHVNEEKPYHVEEYEATHKALEILEENRIALPCEATEEAGWNVEQAIKGDRKKGIRIESKAEELVAKLKECTAMNPTMKRLFDRGGYMVLDEEGLPVHTGRDLSKTEALKIAKEARKEGEKVHLVRSNPAVSPEQYRLAQAVLSGTARTGHMSVEAAREIVDRTPARLRSEYSRYTQNPGGGGEVELGGGKHFLPMSTEGAAKKMARLLEAEGATAKAEKRGGQWGVIHQHANPFYGTDLDLETTMAPAWMYYDSKKARDVAARLYEGEGKRVVKEHSFLGYKPSGKKWRLRLMDHRGNPGSFYQRVIYSDTFHEVGEVTHDSVFGPVEITARRETNDPEKRKYEYDITPVTKRERTRRSTKPYGPGPGKRYRGNPQPAADDMYSSFHGEQPDEVIEYENEEHYHSHLAALGELVELKVKLVNGGRAVIGFEGGGGEDETVNNPGKPFIVQIPGSQARKTFSSPGAAEKYAFRLAKEHYTFVPVMFRPAGEVFTIDHVWVHPDGRIEPRSEAARKSSSKHQQNPFWPFDSFTHSTIYHVGTGEKYKKSGSYKGYTIYQKLDSGEFLVPALDKESRFDTKKDVTQFIDSWVKHRKNPRAAYYILEERGGLFDVKAGPYSSRDRARYVGAYNHGDHILTYKQVENLEQEGKLKPGQLDWRGWPKSNPGPFHSAGQLLGKGRRAIRKPMDDFLGAAGKVGGYLDDELGRVINPTDHTTGPVYLTSNEDGTQLFIVGGDQSIDLPGLGITGPQAEKELVTIGQVTNIVYHAHKIFDGKREEYDYTHKLSEDSNGPLPVLVYDRINQQLKLSGGMYKIERPLIGTSPGIED